MEDLSSGLGDRCRYLAWLDRKMETFETIWESSRDNVWSDTYWIAIAAGVAVLIACGFIPKRLFRWVAFCIFIAIFSYSAGELRFQEINEKWRIRHDWVEQNEGNLSDAQREISITDGANLILGPLDAVFSAMIVFSATIAIIAIARKLIVSEHRTKAESAG